MTYAADSKVSSERALRTGMRLVLDAALDTDKEQTT